MSMTKLSALVHLFSIILSIITILSDSVTSFAIPTKQQQCQHYHHHVQPQSSVFLSSSRGYRSLFFPIQQKQQLGLSMTKLLFNGKVKEFKAGTPLSKAVAQLGCKVTYSCRKGDCATCQVLVDGRMTRACTGKVPDAPKDKPISIIAV